MYLYTYISQFWYICAEFSSLNTAEFKQLIFHPNKSIIYLVYLAY